MTKVLMSIIGDKEFNEKKLVNQRFVCNFIGCNLSYNRQWKLDRHYCSHTGQRPFLCDVKGCEKSYQCKSHLQRHVRNVHLKQDIRLPCMHPSCKSTFSCKSSLLKHYKNHGQPRSFQCSECHISFLKESRLLRHELAHRGVLPFNCQVCSSSWANLTLLRRHMRIHALFSCEHEGCKVVCESRSLMRKHEKMQHRVAFKCEHCNKLFNNKGMLRDHVLVHIPREERKVLCCPHLPCQRFYFHKRNLRHHIKVFHNNERFYCTVNKCLKSFLSQVKLDKHRSLCHSAKNEKRKQNLIENLIAVNPVDEGNSAKFPVNQEEQFTFLIFSRDHI